MTERTLQFLEVETGVWCECVVEEREVLWLGDKYYTDEGGIIYVVRERWGVCVAPDFDSTAGGNRVMTFTHVVPASRPDEDETFGDRLVAGCGIWLLLVIIALVWTIQLLR